MGMGKAVDVKQRIRASDPALFSWRGGGGEANEIPSHREGRSLLPGSLLLHSVSSSFSENNPFSWLVIYMVYPRSNQFSTCWLLHFTTYHNLTSLTTTLSTVTLTSTLTISHLSTPRRCLTCGSSLPRSPVSVSPHKRCRWVSWLSITTVYRTLEDGELELPLHRIARTPNTALLVPFPRVGKRSDYSQRYVWY